MVFVGLKGDGVSRPESREVRKEIDFVFN